MIFLMALAIFTNMLFVQDTPKRIATLSPAITQTIIDIGLEDRLACATGPLDKIKMHKKVDTLGLYHKPNIELIIKCKPDLIITTYAGTPPELHKKLKDLGYNVILEKPEHLSSIKDFIIKLSKMFHLKPPKIAKDFDNICVAKKTRTAIMVVGVNPIFAAGSRSFVSDAMECAGYKNVMSGGYKRTSIEKIISLNPERLILAMENVENTKDYRVLKKVFGDRIIIIDPNIMLVPSTRILEGVKELKLKNN